MNTPSHAILNLALLGRRSKPQLNSPIFWGALVPDLAMFVFFVWGRFIVQMDNETMWGDFFFRPFWQDIFAVGNSIPLALLSIGIALGVRRRYPQRQAVVTVIIFIALSSILHCLADLPLHADDAHRHFWPLSNFRYNSPISYWNPENHGQIFVLVETLLVLVASWRVWQLLRSRWAKVLLIGSNIFMIIMGTAYYTQIGP
ncbi:MAG: hypothetical protein AAF959_16480 [Cyanobacteria bacterium P01_D01_bin.56]